MATTTRTTTCPRLAPVRRRLPGPAPSPLCAGAVWLTSVPMMTALPAGQPGEFREVVSREDIRAALASVLGEANVQGTPDRRGDSEALRGGEGKEIAAVPRSARSLSFLFCPCTAGASSSSSA